MELVVAKVVAVDLVDVGQVDAAQAEKAENAKLCSNQNAFIYKKAFCLRHNRLTTVCTN